MKKSELKHLIREIVTQMSEGGMRQRIEFVQDWKSKSGVLFKKGSSIPTWLDEQGNAQLFAPTGTSGLIKPEIIPQNVIKVVPDSHSDMGI